jgi:hypothetical protein
VGFHLPARGRLPARFTSNRAAEFRIGFPGAPANLGNANLSFDDTSPLTLVEIQGHKLAVDLDTGTGVSSIWPRFGVEFPELVEGARESRLSLSGATGSVDVSSITLPELRMGEGSAERETIRHTVSTRWEDPQGPHEIAGFAATTGTIR